MRILLCVTGGIAAIKTIELVHALQQRGHEIKIVMSEAAQQFIDPNDIATHTSCEVHTSLFDTDFSVSTILHTRSITHIALARWADIIAVVPLTATTLGKIAHGIPDSLISAVLMATKKPVVCFPSMNTAMWEHPATVENKKKVQSYGIQIVDPAIGSLACGEEGAGRQHDIETICTYIEKRYTYSRRLNNKLCVITSGATREMIDAVRLITNKSTGKMGAAFADAAVEMSAKVILLHSSNATHSRYHVPHYVFNSYEELRELMHHYIPKADMCIHTAAIGDFHIPSFNGKLSSDKSHTLTFTPREKILPRIRDWNSHITTIAVKAVYGLKENEDMTNNIYQEFMKSNRINAVLVNDISRTDIGFASQDNEMTCFISEQASLHFPKSHKHLLAQSILETLCTKLHL